MATLKEQTISGFFWKAVEKFSTFGMNFIFSVLIARILTPADFGTVTMIGIFLAISQTFIDSGFGTALIRKIDRTQTDYCTVFYFNIAVSCFFYAVLWFCAPLIAQFYETPILTPVTRAMGLNLIVGAISGIQGAKLAIDLNFKTGAKITFFCSIVSGVIGLTLAYNGFGIWTIVAQAVLTGVFRSVMLWMLVKWRPNLIFSWKSFKELFSFGSKLLASALLDTGFNNLYPMIIGKFFSPQTVGFYGQAHAWASMPSSNLTGIIQSVTFPVLSKMQEDLSALSAAYTRFLRMSAFIVFPLMLGLAALAHPLVMTILGAKWEFSATLLSIICCYMLWYPIHAINLNILQVLGRSDYFLKLEIIKKIQAVVVLVITVPMGITAMCWGSVISSFICLIYNTYYTRKLIGYGFISQMRDLFPILIQSAIMAIIAWGVSNLFTNIVAGIIAGVVVGATYYIGAAKLLRWSELRELIDIAGKVFGGRIHIMRRKIVKEND
ncbi:MAG: lipopolysaccharide biosynthesis protein [Muribaculaceae bacterium]|nr:lipopolysaccharide biosynthesis protein [Muribaculaceae bacterium]